MSAPFTDTADMEICCWSVLIDVNHIYNVETGVYYLQAILSLDFHCTMEVSESKESFRDLKEPLASH